MKTKPDIKDLLARGVSEIIPDKKEFEKLLSKKKEIQYLASKIQQKGLTLVPLKMYTKKGKIKLEIAIAKGKGKADKRETIKKRDIENEMRRELHIRG